jgi:CheY-like chemotaxis protein
MPASPLTILLVRDDPAHVPAWDTLRGEGNHVVAASTPNLALDLVLKHKPDVVVLDLSQTHVNQFALARVIRASLPATTPIVVLSSTPGHSMHDEASVVDMVLRPPLEVELLGGLLRLLHDRRRGNPDDATNDELAT